MFLIRNLRSLIIEIRSPTKWRSAAALNLTHQHAALAIVACFAGEQRVDTDERKLSYSYWIQSSFAAICAKLGRKALESDSSSYGEWLNVVLRPATALKLLQIDIQHHERLYARCRMKEKMLFGLVTAMLLMNITWNPVDSPRPTLLGGVTAHAGVRVDFGFFYNELAPYGNWRQIEPYGWVWHPDVAEDWRPYTVGYWIFTDDYGWTWISKDPWGSIPYHYGRWFYDEGYGGWAWVPDTEWGPAWVGWRSGGGHIGWAPLPPQAKFELSIGFSPSNWDFGIGSNSWCFVPTPQFLSPRIERVIVPRPRNVTLIRNTANVTRYTVINRRVVNRSIDLGRFEGETRTRVVRHRVDETDRPLRRETSVQNGRVILFRPEVTRTTVAPPPAVRPPRVDARPDRHPEHRPPGTAPWEHRLGDRDRDWQDRGEWPRVDRHSSNGPRSVEFEERDDGRPPMEQERRRQRPEAEQQTPEERRQEAAWERARRWTEREQRQPSEQGQDRQRTDQERTQRPAEREHQQAQRQAEREAQRQADQAQRQAEREARRQAEREQTRQQAIQQQTEQQEKAQRQAEREVRRQADQAQRQAEREARRQ